MPTPLVDATKGVALSPEDMTTIHNIFDLAAKVQTAGFVVKPEAVAFCPLAWLLVEVTAAAAHYCFEESHFGGGDIAAAQKLYEQNAAQVQAQLKVEETKSKKNGAQLLSEFKNYMKK
jgi:hypothetical protein